MTPETATHLLRHGHALLLVPCEEPPEESFCGPEWFYPVVEDERGWIVPGYRSYGIYGDDWHIIAPHAPGDVIQVGDQQATVTEVLPPVRVEQFGRQEWIDLCNPSHGSLAKSFFKPSHQQRHTANWLAEHHPEFTSTTYVWRIKINKEQSQ